MRNFEQLTKEAIERGIRPGAKIACAYGTGEGIVQSYDKWENMASSIWCGRDNINNSLRAYSDGKWATVITPAPGDKRLVDGMACEPDEHMRRAIVAKAKELGLLLGFGYVVDGHPNYPGIAYHKDVLGDRAPQIYEDRGEVYVPSGEFYDRLCCMKKLEPRIWISDDYVVFDKGSIQVGCAVISNDVVEQVYKLLKWS